jgi:hypothetical protein
MTIPASTGREIVVHGTVQLVEVSAALRLFPVQRFTDDVPHVHTRVDVDMRRTLGQSTRHVGGTNPTLDDHAAIGSP